MTTNNSTTTLSNDNMGLSEAVGVEAYSVVLSTTVLVLAVVLGGGGCITILLAVFHSRSVRKYSYTLLLVFFIFCCGLDLVWSPIELVHLLIYHHSLHHPSEHFAVVTFAIYVFLCAGVSLVIMAFCMENVLRLTRCFCSPLRRVWPVVVCGITFITSIFMTVTFVYASLDDLHEATSTYLILHPQSCVVRLSILTVLLLVVVVAVMMMVVAGIVVMRKGEMKSSDSYTSGECNNDPHPSLPHFLLNQTEVTASTEDVDHLSTSPSSLSKLPNVTTSTTSVKGHSSPRQNELPHPGLGGSSMLGVNMAQVLGRRRHTICQIGDTRPAPDPVTKSKQYNYVRKFSVDISALQAQLENPKIFKDKVPFQSDQDLTQRQHNMAPLPEARGPLLPLTNHGHHSPKRSPVGPLTDLGTSRLEGGDSGSIKLSLLPPHPPVITVSEEVKEDMEGETEEEGEGGMGEGEREKGFNSVERPQYMPITDKEELTSIPKLPVTQPVAEEEEEEDKDTHPHEEDASSTSVTHHYITANDRDFVKMTLMMALTFVLCTLPLLLMEVVRDRVHVHTYVNVSTCARALSIIQTIIYPHIVLCMDRVVHKAVGKLKARAARVCGGRDCGCLDLPGEQQGSSATSQL